MAISKAVIAIIVIAVLVIASVGAYELAIGNQTVTVTTTVGGSGTITQTQTQTVTVNGANYNKTLVDLAKAEGGAITCYCVMDTSDWPKMNAVLQQSFPWMTMNYVGLAPGDIYTKGLTDFQTGHVQADVFVDTLGPVVQLIAGGAVNPYNNYQESLTNISSANRDPANMWHPAFNLPIILEYNTNLVTSSQAGNLSKMTIEHILTNSTWNGKIALDKPSTLNVAGTLFASLFNADFGGNNATWSTFLGQVKSNGIQWQASGGDVYTAVETGAAAIGIGLLNDYLGGPSGAPVKIIYYPTTYVLPVASAMAKNAPHPYTAELFLQWLSSYAGAVAFSLTGRTPYFGVVAQQYFGNTIPPGTSLVSGGVFTGSTYYTDANGWAGYYASVIA
ncbi:MAG: ABC transporter substrate-binding protein [Nitrososphaerales archaeon]